MLILSPSVLLPQCSTFDRIKYNVEKKDENGEKEMLINKQKQNQNGRKIDVDDLTHPYDYHTNCLLKWLDRITYVQTNLTTYACNL